MIKTIYFPIVAKWSIKKILSEADLFRLCYDYDTETRKLVWTQEFNPCVNLNNFEYLIERADPKITKKFAWWLSEIMGIIHFRDNTDMTLEYEFQLINAPATIRMEALLRSYFPDLVGIDQIMEELKRQLEEKNK